MNSLSRNCPIALVVGAAGFIGSHLVEKLLDKGVQIIAIDNLSSGFKDNLSQALKDKNFYFFNQSADVLPNLELSRLDYAFFVLNEDDDYYREAFCAFLNFNQNFSAKMILVSSINLYDKEFKSNNLHEAERLLANFSSEHKANARMVRLSAVFGPRMHFREDEPIVKMINAALQNKINDLSEPLEFTSRAIYVDDAVDLLIKAVFHGSTAQKIYDGVRSVPVKVSEIREVLIDPLWHESRGFVPTPLPPWPTPNLLKTEKELSWKANSLIVAGLKRTLNYFKENPDRVIKYEKKIEVLSKEVDKKEQKGTETDKKEQKAKVEPSKVKINFNKVYSKLVLILVLGVIFYALIYPVVAATVSLIGVRDDLKQGARLTVSGDYPEAENALGMARKNVQDFNTYFDQLKILSLLGVFNRYIELADNGVQVVDRTVEGSTHALLGAKYLRQALGIFSGEEEGDLNTALLQASFELDNAEKSYDFVLSKLSDPRSGDYPSFLKANIDSVEDRVGYYRDMASQGKDISFVLASLVADDAKKSYLVLLLDNFRLRPGGGKAISYAQIDVEKGRVVNIRSGDTAVLDSNLVDKPEVPFEIKKDFAVNQWGLQYTGFDADNITNSRLYQWFYQKSGTLVSGVVVFDVTQLSNFLEVFGPVTSGNEVVNKSNLFGKLETNNKLGGVVLGEMVKRMVFISKNNWPEVVSGMSQALREKHLMVYFSDPTVLSYVLSRSGGGVFPREQKDKEGTLENFISMSETNLLDNNAPLYLKRVFKLQTNIDKEGNANNNLNISYQTQSPESQADSGKYKFRLKLYLSSGARVTKAKWGSMDIMSRVTPFNDYGRAGFTTVLELSPKEQKSLAVEYQGEKVVFLDDGLAYKTTVYKQPGTDKDPLVYTLSLPANMEFTGDSKAAAAANEVKYSSDLSIDRSFNFNIKRSF